jgi:hypothetical protein
MIFKDCEGKDLEVGQKVGYTDPGMVRGEILEIEKLSVVEGPISCTPKIWIKVALNFLPVPPGVGAISVNNLLVYKDAPKALK